MGFVQKPIVAPRPPGEPLALEALCASLDHPQASERRAAARALTGVAEASPRLLERLHREDDGAVREVILSALTACGDEVALPGLLQCLRSEDVALRNEAVEAMKQLPTAAAPHVRALLTDVDPDVRIFAINILAALPHPEVEQWLLDVIEHDPHLNVCSTAVALLGEVGTAVAREPLARLNARYPAEPYIQFAADLVLRRIAAAN